MRSAPTLSGKPMALAGASGTAATVIETSESAATETFTGVTKFTRLCKYQWFTSQTAFSSTASINFMQAAFGPPLCKPSKWA